MVRCEFAQEKRVCEQDRRARTDVRAVEVWLCVVATHGDRGGYRGDARLRVTIVTKGFGFERLGDAVAASMSSTLHQ